jgi:hypothetical protein
MKKLREILENAIAAKPAVGAKTASSGGKAPQYQNNKPHHDKPTVTGASKVTGVHK